LAYYVAYRIALGLQQHDREVLAHGIETGIIRRLPDGRFIEVHQPLPFDEHAIEGDGHHGLDYAGWVVPKKMNRIGAPAPTVKGFSYPIEKAAPTRKRAPYDIGVPKREEITADREEITADRH